MFRPIVCGFVFCFEIAVQNLNFQSFVCFFSSIPIIFFLLYLQSERMQFVCYFVKMHFCSNIRQKHTQTLDLFRFLVSVIRNTHGSYILLLSSPFSINKLLYNFLFTGVSCSGINYMQMLHYSETLSSMELPFRPKFVKRATLYCTRKCLCAPVIDRLIEKSKKKWRENVIWFLISHAIICSIKLYST